MADPVERLLPDRLWVLFRGVVSPAEVQRPRGGGDHRFHPESADEAADGSWLQRPERRRAGRVEERDGVVCGAVDREIGKDLADDGDELETVA